MCGLHYQQILVPPFILDTEGSWANDPEGDSNCSSSNHVFVWYTTHLCMHRVAQRAWLRSWKTQGTIMSAQETYNLSWASQALSAVEFQGKGKISLEERAPFLQRPSAVPAEQAAGKPSLRNTSSKFQRRHNRIYFRQSTAWRVSTSCLVISNILCYLLVNSSVYVNRIASFKS